MCGGGKNKGNSVGPGGDDGPKEIKVTSVDSKTEPEDILNMFPAALKANIDDDQAQALVEFETSAEASKAFEETPLPKLGPMHVQWVGKGGASGAPEGAGASHGQHGHDSGPGPADDDDDPETSSIKSKPKAPGKTPSKGKGHVKKRVSKTGSKPGSHTSKGSAGKPKGKPK